MENYFILENDYIGYLNDGKRFYSYTEAVKSLHEFIEEYGQELGHPKSKWAVESVKNEKRKYVYKISHKQVKEYGII